MVAAKNLIKRRAMCWAYQVLVWGFLPVFATYGQETSNQTGEVLKAKTKQVIFNLKEGYYGPATQEDIDHAQAGYIESLLEERFVHSRDVDIKAGVF